MTDHWLNPARETIARRVEINIIFWIGFVGASTCLFGGIVGNIGLADLAGRIERR